MNPFFAIMKKELRAVRKEKTIMIAVGIQLFIASFSSVILLGLLSFYDPGAIGLNSATRIKVGILGDRQTALGGYLREANVNPTFFDEAPDAEIAFSRGLIDAIIALPESSAPVINLQLFLPEAETRSTVVMMALREPLAEYEDHLRRASGVELKYEDPPGKEPTSFEFLYVTIIPILMFFPGFVAGSMVVDSISSEIELHTLDTFLSAPVSLNHILGAKIAAALVLALIQVGLWLILLRFNGVVIHNGMVVLLLAAIVAALNGIGAALVTTLLKDRERAQFVYSLMILLGVGFSYLLGSSPTTLMSRLAAGDFFAGAGDTAVHALLLLVLCLLYFLNSKRLMAIKV